MNNIKGKMARKKLKATAAALTVIAPSKMPLRKNTRTSYKGILKNPGSMIRRNKAMSLFRPVMYDRRYFLGILFNVNI